MDLNDEEGIIRGAAGVDYIVHTASPFPMRAPKNEDEVIKPAVAGVLAVCKAAKEHKVKRVVITSSCASIMGTDKT